MKTSLKLVILITLYHTLTTLHAQIPIGTWRAHFSHNNVSFIEPAGDKVYAISSGGLFYIDQQDNSINTLSKVNGLQGNDVSAVHYIPSVNQVLIGYQNGNIDVISQNQVFSIDLNTDSQVIGSKKINRIVSFNAFAYLLTDFGIIKFDIDKLEPMETYRELGEGKESVVVNDAVVHNDSLFISTTEGVMASNISNNVNLLDRDNWKIYDVDDGFTANSSSVITVFDNQIVVATPLGLFTYSENTWTNTTLFSGTSISSLEVENSVLLAVVNDEVKSVSSSFAVTNLDIDKISRANYVKQIENTLWIGDRSNGVIRSINSSSESIVPSGPLTNDVFRLEETNGRVFGLRGGVSNIGSPQRNEGSFFEFRNQLWVNCDENSLCNLPDFNDITAIQRRGEESIIASAGDGLLILKDDGSFQIIDENSSPLQNATSGSDDVIVTSITNSNEGLWVTNFGTSQPLHLWKNDGTWESFSLESNFPLEIINTRFQIWALVSQGASKRLLVFDKDTGQSRLLDESRSSGGLSDDEVNAIAVDRDGFIWVGTGRGISVFTDPLNALGSEVDAVEPIFELRPLLRDEVISAVAVDAGNRKWIGSTNGAWLFDPEADVQLLNFTTANSPLPDNHILDIEIEPSSGEVFFLTQSGIVSYRGSATSPTAAHNDVKIFPNPVTKDFVGTVGISGLVQDASVRITDSSGKLIWKTLAAGGTATWNVSDYNGKRAATGIYLVFSSSADGEETFVGKIAVVN